MARRLLGLVAASDQGAHAVAQGLAQAILQDPAVRLALQVLDGGPHAFRMAIELAGLVLGGREAAHKVG